MDEKILIVDDEKNIVDILKFNLTKEGFTTLEAYDGEEAVKTALNENPDLILLDVMLPKIDGFTVCRKLRGVYIHSYYNADSQRRKKLIRFWD